MLRISERGALLGLSCCLLLIGACISAVDPDDGSGEEFDELGSGSSFLHLLHSFPADSPFVAEHPGKPTNCTQRFMLPSASNICWDNVVGPEEFTKSRLLMLQNRAALQAVSVSSGVEEGGPSYEIQAKDEVQGINTDHQNAAETILTMEKVFVSLEEKRREGKEQGFLTSMKEHLVSTRTAINNRQVMTAILENQFSSLEQTLLNIQLRINQLIQ